MLDLVNANSTLSVRHYLTLTTKVCLNQINNIHVQLLLFSVTNFVCILKATAEPGKPKENRWAQRHHRDTTLPTPARSRDTPGPETPAQARGPRPRDTQPRHTTRSRHTADAET